MRWLLALAVASVSLAGCFQDDPEVPRVPGSENATTVTFIDGFSRPLLVTHASDGTGDLYVVEQAGTIERVTKTGVRHEWGDISGRVGSSGNEQGLLGMAFHPNYAQNGVVILSYTDNDGDTSVGRFKATRGGLNAGSEQTVLSVSQPFANHNGGHVVYGPDGYLYVGLGDGGLAGDPGKNGQNPRTLLGSILRLDVGATGAYRIPSDNPFVDGGGAPEVWLYGLRNPWRFSFDDAGNLWIGDVGQDAWEEISRLRPNQGGANLGWDTWEGTHHYPTGVDTGGTAPGIVFPVAQYANSSTDCSITGGVVIEERYFFGDFCSGTIWSMPRDGNRGSHGIHLETDHNIASFGFGEDGTAYVVSLGGSIEKLMV